MAKNKFLTKVLIVLSATAVLLAACGNQQATLVAPLSSTDSEYIRIKAEVLAGLVPGDPNYELFKSQILAANIAPACPVVDRASCQPVVDADPAMCLAQIATAQATWSPNQDVCKAAGFGYPAMTIDSALGAVKTNGYYCYIPIPIVPTATPKPKPKREEPPQPPPTEPPCVNCPQPPPVEPPCATCPSPPDD